MIIIINHFLKKAQKHNLKTTTFSKHNHNADVVFLNQKKNKKNYLINFKIKMKLNLF